VILLPVGSSMNISNANAIADLDLSNDHFYLFPQKSDLLQKLNCNNINVNINGLELGVFPSFLADNSRLAAEAVEDNTDPSSTSVNGNNGASEINDFRFICVNNNNNTVIETGNGTVPTPPEELANLNVIKNVDCISEGGRPDDDAVCDYVLENILPSNYQMIVTGIGTNAIPSEFPGSSTGTNVQLGDEVEVTYLRKKQQLLNN
jgi:hypothetical protein